MLLGKGDGGPCLPRAVIFIGINGPFQGLYALGCVMKIGNDFMQRFR